jgi:hypothetical protein
MDWKMLLHWVSLKVSDIIVWNDGNKNIFYFQNCEFCCNSYTILDTPLGLLLRNIFLFYWNTKNGLIQIRVCFKMWHDIILKNVCSDSDAGHYTFETFAMASCDKINVNVVKTICI